MTLQDKMLSLDIPAPPANITASNGFKRWGKNNCYWLIEKDGAAFFGDYSTGESHQWFADDGEVLSSVELAKRKEKLAILKKEQEAETIRRQSEVKAKVAELLMGVNTPEKHPYLQRKQIQPCAGLKVGMWQQRQKSDCLLIPMYDSEGVLWNVQAIFPIKDVELCRDKDFLFGGRKQGLYFPIGKPDGVICICEGFATGKSIYEATGYAVAVAFDAGNLEAVATVIRAKYPAAKIIICADNDQFKDNNTGIEKARKAAAAVGAELAIPEFAHLETKPTDFNDLHCLEGLEVVRKQLIKDVTSKSLPKPEELSDTVKKLAELPALEYEKVRDAEAEKLGVRVSALDAEIKSIRKKELGSSTVAFPEVTVWNEPVDAGELLNELVTVTKRFIICDHETAIAVALWCAFTWFVEYVQVAPLAVITAPDKRCGKSQLLILIGKLANRPLPASNISASAIFRVIEASHPTLLIDEADTFFKDNHELRGVINSGHTRQSAYVIRNVGDNHEPQQFSTWGAKAISGIGVLSDTLMDRAIILELRRKLPHEKVERLRHAEKGLFEVLVSKLARFADDAGKAIGELKPELPESLNDRAQDNWEPLLAIADYAGTEWGKSARETAIKLSADRNENLSTSAELLADIKETFETKGLDKISSADLIELLCADDEKSWASYNRGKPITPRQLSKRLAEYHIYSKTIRIGYTTPKGFERKQFEDVFARYLYASTPYTPQNAATPPQSAVSLGFSVADGSATQNISATLKPVVSLDCGGVADKYPPVGKIMEIEL